VKWILIIIIILSAYPVLKLVERISDSFIDNLTVDPKNPFGINNDRDDE
jgi:hypothetical protein